MQGNNIIGALDLPEYKVTSIHRELGELRIEVRPYIVGNVTCV